MTEEEQRNIFSKNLNQYIEQSGKQQKEIAKDLGISPTTFNTWCVGKILPRTGKIQIIADYFHNGIELISINPTFAPMDFSNREISEKPVRIIGKVVELRRKF